MKNNRRRKSTPRLCYASVEFVGGPQDGLRIVDGSERFKPTDMSEGKRRLYSADGGRSLYASRVAPEGGTLFLDYTGDCPCDS
jgi:hypothetical protein